MLPALGRGPRIFGYPKVSWRRPALEHEIRLAGNLQHIGLGKQLMSTAIRMLIHDTHVNVVDRDTG